MREAIGALMARSKKEIPHYYLQTTIDMHAALAWLERAERRAAGGRAHPAGGRCCCRPLPGQPARSRR